jgi:hypothetical protein
VGGVLEYQSLVTGFHFLFILIFLVYLLSYLVIRKKVTLNFLPLHSIDLQEWCCS